MGEMDVSSAASSDMSNRVDNFEIDYRNTDGISDTEETEYSNPNFTKYFGMYKTIPEIKIALDMRAIWTIGKGFKADNKTTVTLDHISGNGIDTFNSILKNMIVVARLNGDSYAEIMRDDNGRITNIKPLDPSSIKVIFDKKGVIKRYEQINKTGKATTKFQPNEIFHLTNSKRVADEIHGTSDLESIQEIVTANKESFNDMRQLMHRHVRPILKVMLDTDDDAKISAFIAKFDTIVNKGENIFIPKDSVDVDVIAVPSNATLNPLPWRDSLNTYFWQVFGIPQVIVGGSGEFTESTAKIAYLAFQQSVEDEQKYIEDQVWSQLYLKINLEFPASIANDLISDTQKDGGTAGQTNIQPNEVTAGVGE